VDPGDGGIAPAARRTCRLDPGTVPIRLSRLLHFPIILGSHVRHLLEKSGKRFAGLVAYLLGNFVYFFVAAFEQRLGQFEASLRV